MKTIFLSLCFVFAAASIKCNSSARFSYYQISEVQMKLRNDTSVKLIYFVNGVKYELEPSTSIGLSFPVNSSVNVIDSKSKKEKTVLKLSAERNGTSALVSDLLK